MGTWTAAVRSVGDGGGSAAEVGADRCGGDFAMLVLCFELFGPDLSSCAGYVGSLCPSLHVVRRAEDARSGVYGSPRSAMSFCCWGLVRGMFDTVESERDPG